MTSNQLDFQINPPPRQRFYQELEHTVGDRTYLYVAVASEVDIKSSTIYARVTLTKYQHVPTQWWKLRNRNFKKIWSLSTSASASIYTTNFSPTAREKLVECAINQSIMPTDLLLEQTIGPIQSEAGTEWQRLQELRFGRKSADWRTA